MPWEKSFDVEKTLEKGMLTFWQQGYESTSMQSLVKSMGVNPGSLYGTFGNKHSLFLKSLKKYQAMTLEWFERLEKEHSPKNAVLAVFDAIIKEASCNPLYAGCLMVNSALEVAPYDKEVNQLVQQSFESLRRFFSKMIIKGQASGEIPAGILADDRAQLLFGLVAGLRVISRGGGTASILDTIRNHAKELLE